MCLAIPGKIISIDTSDDVTRMGKVDFSGIIKTVSLGYTPEAEVGQYVVVHVGFAIAVLDEYEAKQVFAELDREILNSKQIV